MVIRMEITRSAVHRRFCTVTTTATTEKQHELFDTIGAQWMFQCIQNDRCMHAYFVYYIVIAIADIYIYFLSRALIPCLFPTLISLQHTASYKSAR